MKEELFETDYVIYDEANDNVLQDSYGRVLIFGCVDEAFDDLYEGESAVKCTDLPEYWKEIILNQINEQE
jgi:hypothetical protein